LGRISGRFLLVALVLSNSALLTDACAAALRAFYSAAKRGR